MQRHHHHHHHHHHHSRSRSPSAKRSKVSAVQPQPQQLQQPTADMAAVASALAAAESEAAEARRLAAVRDEEARISASRERRRQILAKYKPAAATTPELSSSLLRLEKAEAVPETAAALEAQHSAVESGKSVALAEAEAERNQKLLERLEEKQHPQAPKPQKAPKPAYDMFGSESPEDVQHGDTAAVAVAAACDDSEGYYKFRIGERLGERYEVLKALGKGVFSNVLLCNVVTAGQTSSSPSAASSPATVAIKVSRAKEIMRKAAQKEVAVLRKLEENDPDDRRHCIRLLDTFDHHGHLCIAFESMDMNLRELLNRYGRDIGLNINAVRIYARQLFVALRHIHGCGIIHADLKLDNIVVNETRTRIKIVDFGTAFETHEAEPTPYLASRFYRAPEVILGSSYDAGIDVWAAACTLAEIYTGKILFPGHSNNEMVRLFMELRGKVPKRVLRRSSFRAKHFDEQFNFLRQDTDPVTHAPVLHVTQCSAFPTQTLDSVLCPTPADVPKDPAAHRLLSLFRDMLEKCLSLDPAKRLTASAALAHPFCQTD